MSRKSWFTSSRTLGCTWSTVSELASYAGHVPVYASLGRHDTPAVAAALRKAGVSVADESVHPIAGVAAMGVNSAYIVEFGQAA